MQKPKPLSSLGLLLFLCAAGALPSAGFSANDPPPAVQSLIALLDRAAGSSAAMNYERQRLEAQRSQYSLSMAVDAPRLEFQSEGLDGSLDREANALDTLRFIKPTAAPWHAGARREVRESLADWHRQESGASSLSVNAEVARLWLDWAGLVAENDLRTARLERVERALDLFENRYRLGEVAGTEVRQLEAQRATDRIALSDSRMQAEYKREALFALLGFEPTPPSGESLRELSGWLVGDDEKGDDEIGNDERGNDEKEPAAGDSYNQTTAAAQLIGARAELADDLATLEEKTASGAPSVGFELERIPSMSGMSSIDAFGLQFSLPLPFGRSVARRRSAAREQGALAQAEAERAQLRLDRDLRSWQRQRITSSRELQLIDPLVSGMAQTELSLNEQFRLGAISYLVYLDGVTRLEDVKLRHIQLQQRHVEAHIELGRLTGDANYFPLLTSQEDSTDPNPTGQQP